jgi:hypothetical protein
VGINLATDSLNAIRDSINTAFGSTVASVLDKTDDSGNTTTSCTHCHADMDTAKSKSIITQFQSDFQSLDALTKTSVQAADAAMQGITSPDLLAKLKEAHANLSYAESDESKGYHNHTYLMALLNDALKRSQEILTALGK